MMQQQAAQAQADQAKAEAEAKITQDRTSMEQKGALDIEKEMIRGENKRSMLKLKDVPTK